MSSVPDVSPPWIDGGGFISNSHLYFEGVGGTNIGPNPLYLWLLFLGNWTGTLPKTEPTCEDSVPSFDAESIL